MDISNPINTEVKTVTIGTNLSPPKKAKKSAPVVAAQPLPPPAPKPTPVDLFDVTLSEYNNEHPVGHLAMLVYAASIGVVAVATHGFTLTAILFCVGLAVASGICMY